jgi:hypothetical protein
MLIAALTAYLLIHFGSHSAALTPGLDQAAELIKKDVADEARQKQALAIVEQMKATTKAYAQRREKSIDSLNGVLAKRTTPSSAIVSAAQPLITDDSANAEKLLDLRFQLKTVLTESEWAKVFPAPTASHSAAKRSA